MANKTQKLDFEYEIPDSPAGVKKWDSDNLFLDRDFMLLWSSQISTILGGTILGIAVALLAGTGEFVDQEVNSSGAAMGLVLFLNNFPAFFVAFIAGVAADWFDRKRVMVISNISRIFFLGIFLAFGGWKYAAFAYTIIFLKAVAKQFFVPSEASLIPSIVKKDNILVANSVFNLTNYIMHIGGFIIAAPLLYMLGENGLMFFLMAMFVLASISIILVRTPKRESKQVSFTQFMELMREFIVSFKEGINYIMHQKVQRVAMVQNLVSQSFVFVFLALLFKLGEFLIDLDPSNIGFVSVLPLGVGIAVSVVLLNTRYKNHKRMKLTLGGIWMEGVAFAILSVASMLKWNDISFWGIGSHEIVVAVTFLGAVLIGVGFPYIFIPSQTLIQEETEEGFIGRVYGVWFALSQALASIPAVIFGYLADYIFGVPTTLVWMTIIIFLYSIFVYNNRNLA